MSKLSSNPITQSDIKKYLSSYSDFSFELQVLKKFADMGFVCSHGGTYEDPVTGKSREYDIRALLQTDFIRVHLSVECKNLRENFPLVVHCLERKDNESYNELIHTFQPKTPTQQVGPISLPMPSAFIETSQSIRIRQFSLYPEKQFVAKSADQVGKRHDNGEITSTDGEVFDKISQAINSSLDLITEAHYLDTDIFPTYYTLVCPVLVIPDSSLWQVKYSDDGGQIGEPEQINHVSYYIGKEWTVGDKLNSLSYTISHLEIITYSEIQNFVEKYLGKRITFYSDIISSRRKFW
jgi:hypothetical protein